MFIWPRLWYSSAPRIPTGRSRAASDVPFAVSWSNPASSMSPGMTTIAPPTPNNPETTPATKPISATSAQVIALSSLEGVRSPATAARSLDAEHVAGLEARTHLGRQRRAVQQRAAGRAARPARHPSGRVAAPLREHTQLHRRQGLELPDYALPTHPLPHA